MGVIVGAYAAAPHDASDLGDREGAFYRALGALPDIDGLEVSWRGGLHPRGDDWFTSLIAPGWSLVLTDVAHTGTEVAGNPAYGLASSSADGRRRAVADVRMMHDTLRRTNDALGRRAAIAVELHSAPTALAAGGGAATHHFADSLTAIAGWDWDGASLLVEHCDAAVIGRPHQKGYLTLGDEVAAIRASGADIGIVVNWGRSAIEHRSADGVVEHIHTAVDAGMLRSLVFSGVSAEAGPYGPGWADAHLPLRGGHGTPGSLLTDSLVHRALAAAGPLDWVGAKMGFRPLDAPDDQRLAMIADAVARIASTMARREF